MIINWDGRAYQVDYADLKISQAEAIEKYTGLTIGEWLDSLGEKFEVNSPQFLKLLRITYWLMLAQNGDPTPLEAVDFPLVKFGQAFKAAATVEVPGPVVPAAAQVVPAIPPVAAPGVTFPGPSIPPGGTNGAVPAAYRSAQG